MEHPKEPQIYVLVGKPRTGKSYAVKSMVYHLAKNKVIRRVICITKTAFNGDYDYVPPDDLWEGYDDARVSQFLNECKERKKAGKALIPTALIFDDMLGQLPLDGATMKHLMSCFRHYNLYVFFTSQYLNKAVPPYMRECLDWAVMFRTINKPSVEAMCNAFGGLYDTPDEFKSALLKATAVPHQALLFHNNQDSKEQSYFTFIADEVPDFELKSKKRK